MQVYVPKKVTIDCTQCSHQIVFTLPQSPHSFPVEASCPGCGRHYRLGQGTAKTPEGTLTRFARGGAGFSAPYEAPDGVPTFYFWAKPETAATVSSSDYADANGIPKNSDDTATKVRVLTDLVSKVCIEMQMLKSDILSLKKQMNIGHKEY